MQPSAQTMFISNWFCAASLATHAHNQLYNQYKQKLLKNENFQQNFNIRALHYRCTSVAKRNFNKNKSNVFGSICSCAACCIQKAAPVPCSKNPWINFLKILKKSTIHPLFNFANVRLGNSTLLSGNLSPTF